ncbi:MAG TPA: succinylglutamate desuccinylase/aspartoacylase family protein [Candidatus Polarisedimenticolia bacterium]|nr:succinylglutamate desuccinylase/aspartoacylase family protein [Candidatus Polarisedimenticolia bacterium]
MSPRPLSLGGRSFPRGAAGQIYLKVGEHATATPVNVPVTVVRGARQGPTLFLTAAVHGDELNGVEVVRQVMTTVAPEGLRGTLICVPVVNRMGFLAHSRYLPGHHDLNRVFPGSPDGHAAARLAHVLFNEIVGRSDYGIDLHTASHGRTNLPHVRARMEDPKARRLARAFGLEVIVDSAGPSRTLRAAATRAGVPTILFEAGETFRFQRHLVARGVRGVHNLLAALKMIDAPPRRPRFQIVVKVSEWVRAPRGGIADVQVRPGELVYAGDAVASITNPFGREVSLVRSPLTGLVLGMTTVPMVQPGDALCHVAKLHRTLATVERFALADSRGRRTLLVEGV